MLHARVKFVHGGIEMDLKVLHGIRIALERLDSNVPKGSKGTMRTIHSRHQTLTSLPSDHRAFEAWCRGRRRGFRLQLGSKGLYKSLDLVMLRLQLSILLG